MLCGLSVVCENAKPEVVSKLCDVADSLVAFLLNSFVHILPSGAVDPTDEDNLKLIIHLVGLLMMRSEIFAKKMSKAKALEVILTHITAFSSTDVDIKARHNMSIVRNTVVRSVLAGQLYSTLKSELIDLRYFMCGDDVDDVFPYQYLLDRLNSDGDTLYKLRDALRHKILSQDFKPKREDVLKFSSLISYLRERCHTNAFLLCSHILKVIIIFLDHPVLKELLLFKHQQDFLIIFLATLRCENVEQKDMLLKYWLTQRICNDVHVRSVIYLSDGGMMAVINIIQSVNLTDGRSLDVLCRFSSHPCFSENSKLVEINQIIKCLHLCLTAVDSNCRQHEACDILLIMVSGLKLTKNAKVTDEFANSGLIVTLLNTLEVGVCGLDLQEKLTLLLCRLLDNDTLRQTFVSTSEDGVKLLANKLMSCRGKTDVFLSLLEAVDILSSDVEIHLLLISNGIISELVEHVKDILSNHDCTYTASVNNVSMVLHILNKMASLSGNTCKLFQDMKLELFLSLLVLHENKDIRSVVVNTLKKIGSSSRPRDWHDLFKHTY